jgi:PilZ domain
MTQEPTSPGRRRFERTPARGQVLVHCRGRFQRAKIADYSHLGLQLEGTFGLISRDQVLIELVSGVQVPGKVEWSLGGLTGIAFSEPLETSHPAMVELVRKAT